MSERPRLCLFSKLYNEIIRAGDVYRMLSNAERYCDAAVVLDDGSLDGTWDAIKNWTLAPTRRGGGAVVELRLGDTDICGELARCTPPFRYVAIRVPPEHPERDFRKELLWKQRMLDVIHLIKPEYCWWMDGDEVLDADGTERMSSWLDHAERFHPSTVAWSFHYSQLWRSSWWARTDAGFDEGYFIKLWRYRDDLDFEIVEKTHHHQFPRQLVPALQMGLVQRAPFEVIHYGNWNVNLRFKAIQYHGGLGGVTRHLVFHQAQYRRVDPVSIPDGCERDPLPPGATEPPLPQPFTDAEQQRILALRDLRALEKTFVVVIPTYNRASTLPTALESVLAQTYERWVVIVLDDGSIDGTPELMREWQERDPRIFYARYPENRGGVAMNEIGMGLSCAIGEYWTRLGSDDWWGVRKLEADAAALENSGACFGPYVVVRGEPPAYGEVCNGPATPETTRQNLLTHVFMASWANVALRTDVLRKVRERYRAFCDPRIRNMEDFLVNARIAREAAWVWRMSRADGSLVIDPSAESHHALVHELETLPQRLVDIEAVWRQAVDGASANPPQYVSDETLTRLLITQENIRARVLTEEQAEDGSEHLKEGKGNAAAGADRLS